MKVGIVCPYDWSAPGGVQVHIRDLAVALRGGQIDAALEVLAPVLPRPPSRNPSCNARRDASADFVSASSKFRIVLATSVRAARSASDASLLRRAR